jgi:hypothetical protein
MALSGTMKIIIVFGITMALVIPGLSMIPRGPENTNAGKPYTPASEQPSQPLANQRAWEDYNGQGADWQTALNRSLFTRNVTLEQLKVLAGEEAQKALNGSAASPPSPSYLDGANGSGSGTYEAAQKGSSQTQPREVEEADIVKLQGDYLYVLNPYRGLIIVGLQDKDRPAVTGALRLQGYPQDMYVAGNLSFVILSATYGFWYNYYTLEASARGIEVIGGVEVSLGTHIAVINLRDKAAPRLVMDIPLPGFASDSRRVGDVIYAVTNSYAWTGYGSDNGGTYVTSVDFTEPSTVRRVDTLFFNGTSNQVHASSTAFFLAQPQYSYSPERPDTQYSTKVTYIDISDPRGGLAARGSFVVPGSLSDKYQMDEYKQMFRIVTHSWGSGGQLGSSTLTIYGVSNPDNMNKISALDIEDAGTLMATRFAGDRAYTIHLPHSIDPLDVIDLSDPFHPRLTDQLEMPGWITHLEVRGYKLLALGVDNSGGDTTVAVSLFDVSNPFNAILKARVRIGSGYTWSLANWEPKALTVVDEQNLVIVPFSSTSAGGYWSSTTNGVQLVEFDLGRGTLSAKGVIANSEPVTRTRAHGDRILATSDYALQVIDASDRANPKVVSDIQFVWNIQDAFRMGGAEVQLYSEGWEGASGIRIVSQGANDWDRPLANIPLNLSQISLFPQGKTLYVLGATGDELRLVAYDLTDPSSPRYLGSASKTMQVGPIPIEYGASKGGSSDVSISSYYYSLRTVILDNGVLAVLLDTYYGEENKTVYLFDLSGGRPVALADLTLAIPAFQYGGYYNIGGFLGSGKTLYITFWGTDSYVLRRISLADPSRPVQLVDCNIRGELVGAEPDGSAAYTTAYVYMTDGRISFYSYTFNIYKLDADNASLSRSIEFDNVSITSARVAGGKVFLTVSNGGYYYGYGYGAAPGGGLEGDAKGSLPVTGYTPPQTDLVVVDLTGFDGPALLGRIGMDGYASITEVSGGTVFVTGEGMLAAYSVSANGIQFVGALALRGYIDHVRTFDGGALVSEGLYGVETLAL